MSSLPNCDGCGKFTSKGLETELPTSTPWNGPNVVLYCPRCAVVAMNGWSLGFGAGRNADHNSMWWPKNPFRVAVNPEGERR